MRNILLKSILLCILSLFVWKAQAEECVKDGIRYDLSGNEATVIQDYYLSGVGKYSLQKTRKYYSGDITIPSFITYNDVEYSVTSIGNAAFSECTGLTSITIPNSVTSISKYAFDGCSGLTSVNIPNSVTSIGIWAFRDCSGLTSVTIPNSVTSIADYAFSGCSGLTSVTIPNSVTSIGSGAFDGCTGLTSVSIPNSVTSIGNYVFSGCGNLTNVTLDSNEIVSASRDYNSSLKKIFGEQVSIYVLGNNVTEIGKYAFYKCSGLTSVNIPNSVTSIGYDAFNGCTGLVSITIPSSVTSISDLAFSGCSGLTSVTVEITDLAAWCTNPVTFSIPSSCTLYLSLNGNVIQDLTIPNSVTKIGNYAFAGCSGLTSVTIPNSVTEIGNRAFYGCSGLTSVTIPNSVTSIGYSAFAGCSGLTSVEIPDDVTCIGSGAFDSSVSIYVKRGTKALLALWSGGYIPYRKGTNIQLTVPSVSVTSTTQTTATIKLDNAYDEYTYTVDGEKLTSAGLIIRGLRPENSGDLYFGIYHSEEQMYSKSVSYKTASISPSVSTIGKTASSISVKGSYIHGDAKVVSQKFKVDGEEYEGDEVFISGLNPSSSHNVTYTIEVAYGKNGEYTTTYNTDKRKDYWTIVPITVSTEPLTLTTSQPKVISSGNVIVAAESNLNDEETNVGFEWRRTDWTDDFASNTGGAAIYDGTMEGYIRNLNTEKLWKFRPYYLSNSGTYYYGDWVGLDPTNTSYFEPTVHTYAKIKVEGNTALVKGYALSGTDKVTVQGFKYWKKVSGGNAQRRAVSIPTDAKTVEASGQVMTAELKDLDYNSEYTYVAFVKTAEGETFYGEEQTFATGEDPTGIESIDAESTSDEPVVEIARYNMNGQRIDAPQKGVNIIRYSNGTTKKVYVNL